jgi:mRNA-degrading endonuclease toxin of MazEF toxin-antitoxin module
VNNGHEESRLDRIERATEAMIRSQSHLLEAQVNLEREERALLTTQVVFGDEVRKAFKAADERMTRIERAANERMTRVETGLAEATDKINALIDLMDRHQGEHRNEKT